MTASTALSIFIHFVKFQCMVCRQQRCLSFKLTMCVFIIFFIIILLRNNFLALNLMLKNMRSFGCKQIQIILQPHCTNIDQSQISLSKTDNLLSKNKNIPIFFSHAVN